MGPNGHCPPASYERSQDSRLPPNAYLSGWPQTYGVTREYGVPERSDKIYDSHFEFGHIYYCQYQEYSLIRISSIRQSTYGSRPSGIDIQCIYGGATYVCPRSLCIINHCRVLKLDTSYVPLLDMYVCQQDSGPFLHPHHSSGKEKILSNPMLMCGRVAMDSARTRHAGIDSHCDRDSGPLASSTANACIFSSG